MSDYFPTRLYDAGFSDLISVIPPGAQLTPTSKIQPTMLGKVPGRKLPSGLWAGYDWRAARTNRADVAQWATDQANVGLRSTNFPAVDIDVLDPGLAAIIRDCALSLLGPAPIRYGRRPKQLLVYRTEEPFGRMRLVISAGDKQHLVEILGEGQQYLVHGTHPATMLPYQWEGDLASTGLPGLTLITREMADHFLTELAGILDMLGAGVTRRLGTGALTERSAADQIGLQAPSIGDLQEAVSYIPNTDELFPVRDDYISMGIAIKAAAGPDEEAGFMVFGGWAGKRKADGRVAGNPDTWLSDWRRMNAPYSIGWSFLADMARRFGYNAAATEFEVTTEAPAANDGPIEAPAYSDQWLADRVVAARTGELRFIPLTSTWIVWDGARWQPDAELLAENIINQELRKIAAALLKVGGAPREQKDAQQIAVGLCSNGKATSVRTVMQSNRAVAVSMETLDHDQWVLNTPGGIVDLTTGALLPSDPDALCTKSTSVAPAPGPHPEWDRFLLETTGGDVALVGYLQRMCGYALTGSTREQNLTFIWGKGGNGKGTFLNVLIGILKDYVRSASMDTFTASNSDKHTTDIAMLTGARLVTASETQAGKRWDEQKVKALTGGDPITARFMRQDNFTYIPHFKLVFIGNHKPEIRDVDRAMRRRIQMVPFVVEPVKVDNMLDVKLKAEWPAILSWMIDGCLAWQQGGLQLPAAVTDLTAAYFDGEDALGRWIGECCVVGNNLTATSTDLYSSWREWANQNGEYPGSLKRLSGALESRQMEKWRDPVSRRRGFAGIAVNRQDLGIINA